MQFILSSILLGSFPIEEAVRRIGASGIAGVEIWVEHLWRTAADLESLRRQMDGAGLRRTVHAPSRDINLTSSNPGIRRESLRQGLEALETASRLGAPLVTVHPGRLSASRDSPEDYREAQMESLRALRDRAGELGLRLSVEMMESRPGELLTTPEEANRVTAGLGWDHCGLTFDVAHAITRQARGGGEGAAPTAAAGADPEQVISGVLADLGRVERLAHVHISNSDERNVHLPLGLGRYDLFPVVAALAERFDGLVSVEGYWPGRDLEVLAWNVGVLGCWSHRLAGR